MSKNLLCAAVCSAILMPAMAAAPAAAPLNVGFVYISPIGDAGWTTQHDLARKEMEKALGNKITTRYVENVPESADAERVIRDLAQTGSKLVITTSFGYMNPTLKVAKQFPNVKFIHLTGYKTAPNVANTNARFYEGRYLAGVLAGATGNPAILAYANKLAPTDRPDIGYAMIFPSMTILKILLVNIAAAMM